MKLTAGTITDAQIRELREQLKQEDWPDILRTTPRWPNASRRR